MFACKRNITESQYSFLNKKAKSNSVCIMMKWWFMTDIFGKNSIQAIWIHIILAFFVLSVISLPCYFVDINSFWKTGNQNLAQTSLQNISSNSDIKLKYLNKSIWYSYLLSLFHILWSKNKKKTQKKIVIFSRIKVIQFSILT